MMMKVGGYLGSDLEINLVRKLAQELENLLDICSVNYLVLNLVPH